MKNKIRPIAMYLPQFHPIPENDEWWGKGFTEWTNVTKAKPLYKGHYQPHLPTALGYYDLRLAETRAAQAQMAKVHGIYGFCYYHYWFNGKRILERPVAEILESGQPDFPFMLCWANENWTKTWDGLEKDILLKQDYTDDDDIKHCRYLCTVFKDKRYIRVNGKPFFVIYKPGLFPDIKKTIKNFREVAKNEGIGDLYLGYMYSRYDEVDYCKLAGFDAAIEFPVHGNRLSKKKIRLNQPLSRNNFFLKLVFKIQYRFRFSILVRLNKKYQWDTYEKYVNEYFEQLQLEPKMYPSLFPQWDNTARRPNNPYIIRDATPALYKQWLQKIVTNFKPFSADENFIFINAWNEWAEGNHLEPCAKWGNGYLEATKEVFENNNDNIKP